MSDAAVQQRSERPGFGDRIATLIPGRRLSACSMLIVYCFLLLCIPSRLIIPQIGAPGTPANLWALFLLLWWLCGAVGGREPSPQRSSVRVLVGLLTVAVLVSYAAAMTRGWYAPPDVRQATDLVYELVPPTVDEIRSAMISAADRGLLSFGGWVGVVLVTVDGLRTWRDIDRLLKWLTLFCVFIAGVGIVQFFTGLEIAPLYKIPGLAANSDFGYVDGRSVLRRVQATATGAIEFGVVTAGVFPIALHRAIFGDKSIRSFIPPAAIGFAAALSISRSAIIVLGIALAIMLLGWPRSWRRRCYMALPAAVVGIRILSPGVVGTIRALFLKFGQDNSVTGRTEDYGVAFRIFLENPIFGRGLFTFVPRYYRIMDNQILMLLLELGIVGTLVFVAVEVVAFGNARGARRLAADGEHRHLGLVLSASIAAVFVSYATFDALSFPMAAGLNFMLIGLAGAAWQVATNESRSDHGPDPAARLG